MTDELILKLAEKHSQYKDAKELTLRGPGIVEFARELLAESSIQRGLATVPRVFCSGGQAVAYMPSAWAVDKTGWAFNLDWSWQTVKQQEAF